MTTWVQSKGDYPQARRGYALEEVLAWLLRVNGYRLLTTPDYGLPSEREIITGRNGLLVRGRGSDHQADVLGEFAFTAPFSLPIRLFVEAKFREKPTGLDAVRNAFGVIRTLTRIT